MLSTDKASQKRLAKRCYTMPSLTQPMLLHASAAAKIWHRSHSLCFYMPLLLLKYAIAHTARAT